MEEVLSLTPINSDVSVCLGQIIRLFTSSSFPCVSMESPLHQWNTGYVYILISTKDMNFACIIKTTCVRTRIKKYNSGVGAVETKPLNLWPYAMFAYVCGFNWKKQSTILYWRCLEEKERSNDSKWD